MNKTIKTGKKSRRVIGSIVGLALLLVVVSVGAGVAIGSQSVATVDSVIPESVAAPSHDEWRQLGDRELSEVKLQQRRAAQEQYQSDVRDIWAREALGEDVTGLKDARYREFEAWEMANGFYAPIDFDTQIAALQYDKMEIEARITELQAQKAVASNK